ncbi:MAG: MFS transporter [Sulfobacillus thermosulfidooxidans]|uniref:MFS transporter n=1 Tax=Sulfobacillus thermosulfidooxidans TaxID=28034 RepID=A0A2T2X060_SULTH|nr:MFS transporter [Sulfobacillus thermosulfidooxidans]PSR27862.1 MAG: MFS transporter [Sulfobacillus thermosulfidooxidans]
MRPNYKALGVYLLGVFIGALDTNVLGPVFPVIARSFHVNLEIAAWTVTAYTVAYIASTVLAGALGDRLGHRKVFVWGIILFAVASITAALSREFALFVIARIVQGAGAGAVYPNGQAEGLKQFPPEKHGMALGMFGAVFGLASVIGPTLGGILGQVFGWPAVFIINLPIALIVLAMLRNAPPSTVVPRALPDWVGGASFSAGLASILLVIMGQGIIRLVFFILAVFFFGLMIWRQKVAKTPFLDSKPLMNKAGVAMMIGAALIGLDMSAAIFVPALVQSDLHFSVLQSGLALLPAAFTGALLAGAGGIMVDRMGAKKILAVGLVAAGVGAVLLAWPHLTFFRFILAMMALGLGTAFTMGAPLNRLALDLYKTDQAGEALSLMAVFRATGLAAGPILLTAAKVVHGFTGMYGTVAIASVIGALVFMVVPEHRPGMRTSLAQKG